MGIPIPKVTKTTADPFTDVSVFEDSTTLLKVQGERIFVSFDNGVNWEKSQEIPVDILEVEIDENYRNSRAVATAVGESYLTDDQGKHWRKLNLPKLYEGSYELDTHPFEKDYLLANCVTGDGNSYVSNDGGKNFRKIELPNTNDWGYSLICGFACNSRDSIFYSNKDLVYCLVWGYVFYTDDFGKSIKRFDQFKGHTVLDLRILDSHILVFTLENRDKFNEWITVNLWVSNDGFTFNKAFLPTFLRDPDTDVTIEDGLGRIIITTHSFGIEEEEEEEEEQQQQQQQQQQSSQIFVSDSSGLQFHVLDIGIEDALIDSRLTPSKTSKGTMWFCSSSISKDHTKISFDYGDTWSNLRVVRSPDQPKDLFRCDVDDVENCSLKLSPNIDRPNDGKYPHNQTTGILMTVGSVDEDQFRLEKSMTFISRDGGGSWEVAFRYPCCYAFGDGGNIILAMALSPKYNGRPGEFYYSSDQGKTWKEYQLEAAIEPWEIISTTSDGSNFIIRDNSLDEILLYAIDFTDAFNDQDCG